MFQSTQNFDIPQPLEMPDFTQDTQSTYLHKIGGKYCFCKLMETKKGLQNLYSIFWRYVYQRYREHLILKILDFTELVYFAMSQAAYNLICLALCL